MAGIRTAKADDPLLNVRLEEKSPDGREFKQPVRVISDANVELAAESRLAKTASQIPLWIFCRKNLDENAKKRRSALEKIGVKFFEAKEKNSHLDLEDILKTLGENGIDSVLVESGGGLNAGLFFSDGKSLVDEVHVYIAPKIFGNDGEKIFSPVRGGGISEISDCVRLSKPEIQVFGDDILLKYKVIKARHSELVSESIKKMLK